MQSIIEAFEILQQLLQRGKEEEKEKPIDLAIADYTCTDSLARVLSAMLVIPLMLVLGFLSFSRTAA